MRQFADCKDMLLIQWGDEAGQSRQRQERSPDGRNLSLDLTINGDSGGWLELRRSDTRVLETCQPPAGLDGRKKIAARVGQVAAAQRVTVDRTERLQWQGRR